MALEMWKRKAGPLPMWGWAGLLLGAALLWSLGRSRASSKDTGDAGAGDGGADTVPSDQVPDFISQVYSTTVNNLQGPASTGAPAAPPSTGTTPPSVAHPPIQSGPPLVVPPASKPTTPAKPAKKPIQYKVKPGDSLSTIAKKYNTSWQTLWTFNTTKGNRPDATIATLKKRGPNKLFSGETILIPQK